MRSLSGQGRQHKEGDGDRWNGWNCDRRRVNHGRNRDRSWEEQERLKHGHDSDLDDLDDGWIDDRSREEKFRLSFGHGTKGVDGVLKNGRDKVSGSGVLTVGRDKVGEGGVVNDAQMSNFYLRKGFEVCGILEDVYVAKKRNKYGQPYGFVKFSNVRNVTKMTRALNNVWFGFFRVRASVAMFERNDSRAGRKVEKKMVAPNKDKIPLLKDGKLNSNRHVVPNGGEENINFQGQQSHQDGGIGSCVEKEGKDLADGVRVGDIVVKLGARKPKLAQKDGKKGSIEGEAMNFKVGEQRVNTVKYNSVLMRSYRSTLADAEWVHSGIVATVFNDEAIPVVQNRILDVGFNDVVLIPMGADKVFVRSSEGVDVMSTILNAKEFFQIVFSNWMRWEKDVEPYRRGAWVRLYGIPLNAWNEQFFKICVFDCGRYLRMDEYSADKDRLDFARVLIATTDLDIINRVESVLVDGNQVEVKIVEEGGYTMGDDMCLFEEESESEAAQSDCGQGPIDPEVRHNVDLLVNNITKGLSDEGFDNFQGLDDEAPLDKQDVVLFPEGVTETEVKRGPETSSNLRPGTKEVSGNQVAHIDKPPFKKEDQVCHTIRPFQNKRTNSCPPKARRSVISGPWSLEWLKDQNHGEAGVIFSACKKSRKGDLHGKRIDRIGQQDPQRRKAGGLLRHPLHNLKKVA
ncbi:putative sulfate transporter, partial [Trifolium pratense]